MKAGITTLMLKLVVVPKRHIKCVKPSQTAKVGRMKHSLVHCEMWLKKQNKGRDSVIKVKY